MRGIDGKHIVSIVVPRLDGDLSTLLPPKLPLLSRQWLGMPYLSIVVCRHLKHKRTTSCARSREGTE